MPDEKPKQPITYKNRFNVQASEIKAAILFASQDEESAIMNSVLFQVAQDKQPVLVSLDGRRLAVIESQAPQSTDEIILEIPQPFQVMVGAGFLKSLCAFAKSWASIFPIAFEYHPSKRMLFIMGDTVVDSEKGAVVEGQYHTWRNVIPTGVSEPVSELGINAEYMADYAKAAELIRPKYSAAVRMNLFADGGAIEVHLEAAPNFYGVIMPLKPSEEKQDWQPEFLGMETFKHPTPNNDQGDKVSQAVASAVKKIKSCAKKHGATVEIVTK